MALALVLVLVVVVSLLVLVVVVVVVASIIILVCLVFFVNVWPFKAFFLLHNTCSNSSSSRVQGRPRAQASRYSMSKRREHPRMACGSA